MLVGLLTMTCYSSCCYQKATYLPIWRHCTANVSLNHRAASHASFTWRPWVINVLIRAVTVDPSFEPLFMPNPAKNNIVATLCAFNWHGIPQSDNETQDRHWSVKLLLGNCSQNTNGQKNWVWNFTACIWHRGTPWHTFVMAVILFSKPKFVRWTSSHLFCIDTVIQVLWNCQ